MRFGSLFSGIGGIDLGLERAGMECAWQVENNPYCLKVLAKHWPDVTRYEDISEVDFGRVKRVDLLAGGFPCQDISRVGRRSGLRGAKNSLWDEYARAIRILRPSYVLVENTTSLLVRGMDIVLRDLDESGYNAEWDCLPAFAFGAPHIRDRLYLLAYPRDGRYRLPQDTVFAGWAATQLHGGWSREPNVGRVANGIPRSVDRIRGLGNAVVPQVAQWLGSRILEHEAA